MSKIIEELKRVTEGAAPPMGFGAAARREKTPAMVIVASLDNAAEAAKAVESGAKTLLIDMPQREEDLHQAVQAAGGVPLGVRLKEGNGERLKALAEAGCDFIVVEGINSPWHLLKDSGLGRVLQIEPNLPDNLMRVAGSLPADALLVSSEGWDDASLSIQRQMVIQFIGLARKPVLATLPKQFSPADIEGLWEVGVAGVVTAETDRLSEFRDAITALPASRRKPRGERAAALLPQIAEQIGEAEEEEEEDE